MTHGTVIAQDWGQPAVVGVEHASRLIGDGQRIPVHGADGDLEIPALAGDDGRLRAPFLRALVAAIGG